MKRALLAGLCVLLTGCGSSARDGVRQAVLDYMDAVAAGDMSRICGHRSTAGRGGSCELPGNAGRLLSVPLSFASVTVRGRVAQADVTDGTQVARVHLERAGGRWLLAEAELRRDSYTTTSLDMIPAYAEGVAVPIDLTARGGASVERGDVVLYRRPERPERCSSPRAGLGTRRMCDLPAAHPSGAVALGRVIAVAGDTLTMNEGRTVVDGVAEPTALPYPCKDEPTEASRCSFPAEAVVPQGTVFVLNDYRPRPVDSRAFGPVVSAWILGKVPGVVA